MATPVNEGPGSERRLLPSEVRQVDQKPTMSLDPPVDMESSPVSAGTDRQGRTLKDALADLRAIDRDFPDIVGLREVIEKLERRVAALTMGQRVLH